LRFSQAIYRTGMSGTYPLTRDRTAQPVIRDPDEALCRARDLLESNMDWNDVEHELNKVFDALVTAGYVEEWGQSPTGLLWAITDAGHSRLATLSRD
jgi:hypothetical protein